MGKLTYLMMVLMVLISMSFGCSKSKVDEKGQVASESSTENIQQKVAKTADEKGQVALELSTANIQQKVAKTADEQGQVALESSTANIQQKVAKTADEAIKFAKTLEGVQQKKDYLLAQAQSLYNSEELEEVVEIAKYVLEYVDNDAPKAKQLLEKATKDLEAMASGGIDQAAKKIEGLKL